MELYLKVRLACSEGMSRRQAAKHFNISRDSVSKMLSYSTPPGYQRQSPIRRPKLDAFVSTIEHWLDEDVKVPRKQHRTRPRFADTIRASSAPTRGEATILSEFEVLVLTAVGYLQPITRSELSKVFGKEVSRDTISALRGAGFLSSGPRSPTPRAPYTYITTRRFLSSFGMQTLRDLPNIEALEDAGLLEKSSQQLSGIPIATVSDAEADDA